jgi:hypothetical protein
MVPWRPHRYDHFFDALSLHDLLSMRIFSFRGGPAEAVALK